MWREIAALMIVFALLGAALEALRRRGAVPARGAKSLAGVERLRLTPQHTLHLVRASGKELMIVTHPHGCTLLSEQRTAGSVHASREEKPSDALRSRSASTTSGETTFRRNREEPS